MVLNASGWALAKALKTVCSSRVNFWGAEGAPILFSVLGFSMASCS